MRAIVGIGCVWLSSWLLPSNLQGGTLSGRIVDAGTRQPLAARVYLEDQSGKAHFVRSAADEGRAVVYDKANWINPRARASPKPNPPRLRSRLVSAWVKGSKILATVSADMPIREVNPSEYDILVIPGGYSPERLRLREEAVDIARTFMDEERRVVIIGHGAQLLLSAGSVAGRHLTCAPEVRDDVRAVGGTYHDEPVVSDGNLFSCRGHEELPELCRLLLGWCHSQA